MDLLNRILDTLHVKHTKSYAYKLYHEHPYRYSFWGLSKMLSTYNINNGAFNFTNFNDIYLIESPFVAQLGNEFVLVDKIDKFNVSFYLNNRCQSISLEEFKNNWTGKVLLFEANNASKEPNYKKHLYFYYTSICTKVITIVALLYCYFFIILHLSASIAFNIGVFAFTLLGLFSSFSLCKKELKLSDIFGDKLCSLFRKAHCNAVLESSAAKIANRYSLSAIGLGYFTACLFLCVIETFQMYLFIINCLAILFTLWSVWYQKYKINQYCSLCLIVCGCVWGSFICYQMSNKLFYFTFDIFTFIFVVFVVLLIIFATISRVIHISQNKEMQIQIYKLQSIKNNDVVFSSLLKKQKHYEVENISQFILGNPQGIINVTILSNPHCQPCKKMHNRICEVIKQNHEIKLVYIFSSFNDDLECSVKCLLYNYIHHHQNIEMILEQWYSYGMYHRENFYNEYPYNENDFEMNKEFERHSRWKNDNKLSATPTVLVNGYLLPQEYSVEDLVKSVLNMDCIIVL